jgi:arylsulfate sulfotransferase
MTRIATRVLLVLLAAFLGASPAPTPETVLSPKDVRVIVNPYGIAPLSAVLVIAAGAGIKESAVHRVDVSVSGADGWKRSWTLPYGTPAYMADFDTPDLPGVRVADTVVPVLGLQPDAVSRVAVRIHEDEAGRVFTYSLPIEARVRTDPGDPFRDGFPPVRVSAANRRRMEPGMTLISFSMGDHGRFVTRPFAIDSRGTMRWLLRLDRLGNWASPVEPLQNGNLAFGRGEFVYEYTMLGRRVHAWDIGRYGYTQHHDVVEITSGPHRGDLLVAVDRIKADTVEDFVIEIDRHGALVDTWDLRQVMDVSRDDLLRNSKDWLHMNAVVYDPRDDSIIVSGRNQGIVKVNRDHHLVWIMAPHQGWGRADPGSDGGNTADYLLTATAPDGHPYPPAVQMGHANVEGGRVFDWPWGQHAIELLDNGNLFLFDNGFHRLFQDRRGGFSRAVEYRVDQRGRSLSQVWQYGADRGDDYYSSIISDVDSLPATRNRLVTSGSIRDSSNGAHAYVTELTYPRGEVVFEARLGFRDAHSDTAAGGWGNMDIVYRAERLSLYPGAMAN